MKQNWNSLENSNIKAKGKCDIGDLWVLLMGEKGQRTTRRYVAELSGKSHYDLIAAHTHLLALPQIKGFSL